MSAIEQEQNDRVNSLKEAKKARIHAACEDCDLPQLVDLASSTYGLVDDETRRLAWPLLLGSSNNADFPKSHAWEKLPRHQDEHQVALDVNRSFVYYPSDTPENHLDRRKEELSDLIIETIRNYPFLSYFQGYHDIVQVLLLVFGRQAATSAVARLSLLRVRDFMHSTLDPAFDHLYLLVPILQAADPVLANHIAGAKPFFALPATLTLYAHQIEQYGDIARLFDFLLAKEASISIYFFAATILERKAELLEYGPDEQDVIHAILSKLPNPLNIEHFIIKTLEIYDKHPPERLPTNLWRRISSHSVLKTTRDPTSVAQATMEDGEKYFQEQAKELKRNQMLRAARLTMWNYRRPGAFAITFLYLLRRGMREQAKRCLQYGARRPWTSANELRPSRRMLHSDFWHHGAGDLDLPPWCLSTVRALFEPVSFGNGSSNSLSLSPYGIVSGGSSNIFLDFLYPPDAKVILKRWSKSTFQKWHRQKRLSKIQNYSRQFVSIANHGQEEAVNKDVTNIEASDVQVLNPSSGVSSQLNALRALIESKIEDGDDVKFWEARKLFHALPSTVKTWDLYKDMIHLLSKSSRQSHHSRLVVLAARLPDEHRTTSIQFQTIAALLKQDRFEAAVERYEEATTSGITSEHFECIDLLLAYLLRGRQWALAIKIYGDLDDRLSQRLFKRWERSFRSHLQKMSGLADLIISVAESFHREGFLSQTHRLHRALLRSLASIYSGDEKVFDGYRSVRLLRILRMNDLDKLYFYRNSCMAICRQFEAGGINQGPLAREHFELLRRQPLYAPSRSLLRTMLHVAASTDQLELLEMVVQDFKTHLGPLDLPVAAEAMRFYALRGLIGKVDSLLDEYLHSHKDRPKRLLHHSLHVRAVRADPAAVLSRVASMKDEFEFEPDQVYWGILMKAYQRTEDLDGVLSSLSSMLKGGFKLNEYVLVIAMSTCADRGDVETVRRLLNIGTEHGVAKTQAMNDILVMALIKNGQREEAQNIATTVSKVPFGSPTAHLTRMWNQLLAGSATSKDLDGMHRVARAMQLLRIKFDTMSYAALMRGYTSMRQTRFARRIFEQVQQRPDLEATAFHYSILIDGFAREHRFEDGIKTHADMLKSGLKPNLSSNLALLTLQLKATQAQINKDQASTPGLRPDVAEETFEELLNIFDEHLYADTDPQLRSEKAPITDIHPAAYFEGLFALYDRNQSYHLAEKLISRYDLRISQRDDAIAYRRPVALTTAMMNVHYRRRNISEVERYYSIARSSALRLVSRASGPEEGETPSEKRLPVVRRNLLARPFDLYQRSLAPLNRWSDIHMTMSDLYDHGFDLDSVNWNWYVQLRATHEYYVSAFQACEKYLMPSFKGWQAVGNLRRAEAAQTIDRGLQFQARPGKNPSPDTRVVHYKTIVRLNLSLRKLVAAVQNDDSQAKEIVEVVRKTAPRTIHAIETMPVAEHPIMTHLLRRLKKDGSWQSAEEVVREQPQLHGHRRHGRNRWMRLRGLPPGTNKPSHRLVEQMVRQNEGQAAKTLRALPYNTYFRKIEPKRVRTRIVPRRGASRRISR